LKDVTTLRGLAETFAGWGFGFLIPVWRVGHKPLSDRVRLIVR